jgi:hypothetical protein
MIKTSVFAAFLIGAAVLAVPPPLLTRNLSARRPA